MVNKLQSEDKETKRGKSRLYRLFSTTSNESSYVKDCYTDLELTSRKCGKYLREGNEHYKN